MGKLENNIFKKIINFWNEYKKIKTGVFGIIIIFILLLVVIFEKKVVSFGDAGKEWRNIEYWENNPQNGKPIWLNYLSSKKYPLSEVVMVNSFEEKKSSKITTRDYNIEYNFKYDYPPSDIKLNYAIKGKVVLNFFIKKENSNEEIRLFRKNYDNLDYKLDTLSIYNESKQGIYNYVKGKKHEISDNYNLIDPMEIIFNEIGGDKIEKGRYNIIVKVALVGEESDIKDMNMYIIGKISGIMGTDSYKRDVWSGIIAGVKWALLIGFMVSFISVAIGVIYGIISAYYGGFTDAIMQRIYEFFVNIPLLPILIVLSAVFKPSIWTFIILMSALGWTGSVRTVRSIGLQIKEESFIEASRVLGASNCRIIFTHMLPLLIPYSFASMALAVPSAILAEAGISIIGLGDTTIITWGQMLQDAKTSGAVIKGLWWWIIPPGIMITVVGMSFAFVGFSLDKIFMPKLKQDR